MSTAAKNQVYNRKQRPAFGFCFDGPFHSLAVVSKFWAVVVPGVLAGVIFYAYSAPSYVGGVVRALVDPVMQPILRLASHLFSSLPG